MFGRYASSVSCGCCKSRSRCCICCNDYTCMLQVYVPHVSSIFSDVCYKCVYLEVAHISHICCKCSIWMLHMFATVFHVFQSHVLNVLAIAYVCCNYFIWMFQKVEWVLCNCEPLATPGYCICRDAVHGGERCSRSGGVQEARKCGGVVRVSPTCACSRRWRGHPDVHRGSGSVQKPGH
jgi:hypothetical protein